MAAHQSTQDPSKQFEENKSNKFTACWAAMAYSLSLRDLPTCTYCGVVADSIDHVPAQAVRKQLAQLGLLTRYPLLEVPCCRECNSALGSRGFTVAERRKLVKTHLKRKYKHILNIPMWTDSELGELSPAFRNYVIQGVVLRQWAADRLAYLNKRERVSGDRS